MLVVIDTGANGRVKPLILYVVLFLFIFSCLDFIFNFFLLARDISIACDES